MSLGAFSFKRAICVEKSKILVVLDEDAFSNIDEFHDGSELRKPVFLSLVNTKQVR